MRCLTSGSLPSGLGEDLDRDCGVVSHQRQLDRGRHSLDSDVGRPSAGGRRGGRDRVQQEAKLDLQEPVKIVHLY
jgi:hypothetical protein